MPTRLRSRIHLLLVALVFFGPLLLAAIAYYGPWDWAPRAAHGELMEPPLPLPAETLSLLVRDGTPTRGFRDDWLLIYARTAPCAAACLDHLIRLQQVLVALAEDRDRVRMALFLAGPIPPAPRDATWAAIRLDEPAGKGIVELLGEHDIREGRIYIADPRRRLVMSYPPDAEQKGLLEDLERLLRLSGSR